MNLRPFLPYQGRAYNYALPLERILLFMQMRLGKSIIAARWGNQKARNRKLITAPLSTLHNWKAELELEGEASTILHGSPEERIDLLLANEKKCGWFLTNYEGLYLHTRNESDGENPRKWKRAKPSPIATLPWNLVILDESAEIRNPKTQKVQIVNGYLAQAKYKALLCGLPNPEGPCDFFNQMYFMYGRFLNCKNWWEFRDLVCQPSPNGYGWTPRFNMVKPVREAVQARAFCLTRKEAGIGNRVVRESRHVILPQKVRDGYLKAEREMILGERETMYALDAHQYCSQIAAGETSDGMYKHDAKNVELLNVLQGELKGESVVIWYRYNRCLYTTAKFLEKKKIKCLTVTGQDEPGEAAEKVRQFMAGACRVILFQIKCGKYGRDLSKADTEIFMGNGGGFNDRAQAQERIEHPLKKDRTLLVLDIIAEDTVEQDIYDALVDKRTTARSYTQDVFKRTRDRIAKRKK